MINIRPVSDLRNKYPEIEEEVLTTGEPVFLTKNGYGSMVVMSLEQYSALTDGIELALDEADRAAVSSDVRYSADEVFGRVRKNIYGRKAL
jgi:prevent-host-death family protein